MGKASRTGERRGRRSGSEAVASVLARLEGRFAEFRRSHPAGARVPTELRTAALAALEKGVGAGDLYRRCHISWGQVHAWKAKAAEGEGTDVRVFSVVDDAPVHQEEPSLSSGQGLELRLGPWSVSVRLADPGCSPERGG
jgi:hypothetical protein